MPYRLARLKTNRRVRPFRSISPTKAQADELYRVYLRSIRQWRAASAAMMTTYAAGLATGSVDQVAAETDRHADDIAENTALWLALRSFFISTGRWHETRWLAAVKASAGVDVGMLLERPSGAVAQAVAAGAARQAGGVVAAAKVARAGARIGAVTVSGGQIVSRGVVTGIDAVIANSVAANVSLVRSASEEIRARIANLLFGGIRAGTPTGEIARGINEVLGKGAKRARRIAEDQSVKVIAALTKYRSIEADMGSFKWKHTPQDNPRLWHQARNGKVYRWDDAPLDEPGILPYCKCLAIPILA